ncbi:TsoY family (seleno)protein [Nautilia lithotrophica]
MKKYTPILFLSSLGAGGLTVSFYVYLLFLIPHKGIPLATFDHIFHTFNNTSVINKVGIVLALIGILYFAYKHISLLIWNIKQWNNFKKTEEYNQMKGTLKEISFMAIPLTYAMTINVMFVLGAALVPGLWNIIEYMFPIAILAFLGVGIYAFKIFGEYFIPLILNGNKEWEENNSLVQLLSVFAFAMIGVGFAAPGAMSHIKAVNAIGIFCSFIFLGAAIILGILKSILGFHTIIKNGLDEKSAPSLWIGIPIFTLVGIALVRDAFGLGHHFSADADLKAMLFTLTGFTFAAEILMGAFGYIVLKKVNYFDKYIHSDEKDPATYALICPGVAFFVFGMFFIHWGLVFNGVFDNYSIAHYILIALLAIVQYKTVKTVLKLNKKFGL